MLNREEVPKLETDSSLFKSDVCPWRGVQWLTDICLLREIGDG